KVRSAQGQEAAFLSGFAQVWKALDGVGVNCRLGKDLEFNLTFATRNEALPPALAKFAAGFKEPSAVWQAVPDNALVAVAGRFDLPAFVEMVAYFMAAEERQALRGSVENGLAPLFGKKLAQMLPAHLGPDFGFCLMPPRSDKTFFPEMLV